MLSAEYFESFSVNELRWSKIYILPPRNCSLGKLPPRKLPPGKSLPPPLQRRDEVFCEFFLISNLYFYGNFEILNSYMAGGNLPSFYNFRKAALATSLRKARRAGDSLVSFILIR